MKYTNTPQKLIGIEHFHATINVAINQIKPKKHAAIA